MSVKTTKSCDRCGKEIGVCAKEDIGKERFTLTTMFATPIGKVLQRGGHVIKEGNIMVSQDDHCDKCRLVVAGFIARIFKISLSEEEEAPT